MTIVSPTCLIKTTNNLSIIAPFSHWYVSSFLLHLPEISAQLKYGLYHLKESLKCSKNEIYNPQQRFSPFLLSTFSINISEECIDNRLYRFLGVIASLPGLTTSASRSRLFCVLNVLSNYCLIS